MKELEEILERAITIEHETYRLYSLISAHADTHEKQQFFEELAQEEMEHRDLLKAIPLSSMDRFSFQDFSKVINNPYLNLPSIDPDTNITAIIDFSIQRVNAAYDFFNALKNAAPSKELTRIFEKITNLELALRNRLNNIEYFRKEA